ncbi:hypothetical protein HRI_003431100 [Hibiscus trionum]|uniref:Uncharacterized protein n=1 Tax=Hibiscus trionum TaxID=183268 RepID=A0A9W7ILU4_HIBTR|nr:hypothetical protein HRI_003431100 [Hibiscus trionum]
MTTGAADGFFRSLLYVGCICGSDHGVERRPYHRNCRCALHDKSLHRNCSCRFSTSKKVSYPIRRSWSEGCLAHSSPSPSSTGIGKLRLKSYKE